MPAPSIPRFNGQIKTPWRGGYTSVDQLAENSRSCRAQMDGCLFRLIWKNESLMPFQFIRPFSMSPVTSWILYNPDGSVYRDLTPEIDKLRYFATNLASGGAVQYVSYGGALLDAVLDAGTYYMRIVSGGITYYWEPLLIVCDSYGENVFPDDSFDDGLESEANPSAGWSVYGYANTAQAVISVAGNPTNPAWENEGVYVINTGDNSVYQYLSGSWVQDPTPATGAWYDYATGNFYRFFSGAWVGLVDPVVIDTDSACWAGTFDVPIGYNLSSLPCQETRLRYEITVSGLTTGEILADVDGQTLNITANGTFTFTAFTANGSILQLVPSGGFDGCVSLIQAFCLTDISDCFYRLAWDNCGNIGNTYLAGGFTNAMYLERAIYPVRPRPETTVRSQQRADGSVVPVSRRRETTWEIQVGLVPWYVADALADMAMYDNIVMEQAGGGADVLKAVEVDVEWLEDFGDCLADVTITFQIDAASVACCDDFSPPCKTACVSAEGYTDDPDPVTDSIYLVSGASAYATATGGGFSQQTPCTSGVASITFHDVFVRTVYFDLNIGEWLDLAGIDLVTVTVVGVGECTLNIRASIPAGYSAVLQYLNPDGDWITDESYNLTAAQWADNDIQRVTPDDQDPANGLRLMVYVDGVGTDGRPISGRCTVGYSAEFTYVCE